MGSQQGYTYGWMYSQFIAASYSNITPALQETFYRCMTLVFVVFGSVITIYVASMDLRMLAVEFGIFVGLLLFYWAIIAWYKYKYRRSRIDELESNMQSIRRRRSSIMSHKTK